MRLVVSLLLFIAAAAAQSTQAPLPQTQHAQQSAAKGASASDSASIESIISALYDVISGPPGERDWARFDSLFISDARLITLRKQPDGLFEPVVMTTADYRKRAGEHFLREGFYERSLANRTERFAHVAHVFSTYETKDGKNERVIGRGINSIQLLNDGKRWWVVTILWDQESPANSIPPNYLKSPKTD